MDNIRARACGRCKVFEIVIPNNPQNQKDLQNFEKAHKGHMLITVDVEEIKGTYIKYVAKED